MRKLFNGFLQLRLLLIIVVALFAGLAQAQLSGVGHPQAGTLTAKDFTEVKTCKMCHPTQFEQWEGTMHGRANDDPFYSRVVNLAAADMPGIEEFCSACHAPIAVLTGQDPLDPDSLDAVAQGGIVCDFCHTVSDLTHIGNFGYKSSPGNIKFGPFDVDPRVFHKARVSPLHDSAEFCGMCHDVSHPVNGLALETTYSEFEAGPYPADGFKCQTCHMTPGHVKFEAFPGRIASTSEVRDHIWTHQLVGANAFVPELLGQPEIAAVARLRLSLAATVEIGDLDAGAGQRYFEVTVTNVGAGHNLPTGVTEERQIWLEVEVYDAAGNLLNHFGTTDENGVIADDTMILMTQFGDAEGKPTHQIWRAQSILSDRRIPPRGSDTQPYHIAVGDGPEPVRVVAKLWYRSSHPEFIAELFSDSAEPVEVPHVLMAETEREW